MHRSPVSIVPLAKRAILRAKAGFEIQEATAQRAALVTRTKAIALRTDGKPSVDIAFGNWWHPGKSGESFIHGSHGNIGRNRSKCRQIWFAPDVGIPFAMGARGAWIKREVEAFQTEAPADFHDHGWDIVHGIGNPLAEPSSGGI